MQAEPAIVSDGMDRYLRAQRDAGQLVVTDSYRAEDLCHAGHSAPAIRCGNL